ncbi:endolysin [Erwinia phage AH06]|nr:endolysin [Erwinia phage AH06]
MAENVKVDYEDLGDLDLDFDFDFSDDASQKKKGKGGAIREFAAGLWTGAKEEVFTKGTPQRIIRSLLPVSFSPAFDAKDRAARFKDDLYDKVKSNTRNSVNDIKDLTLDALSMYGGKLPDKVLKQIEVWAENKDIDYSVSSTKPSDPSLEDGLETSDSDDYVTMLQQSTLQASQLAVSLHKESMAQTAAVATKQMSLSADSLAFMQGIHRMTARTVGFNEQFTANYQRKSLELQYRSYKLQLSIGKMHERYYKRSLEAMSGLVKNTGLTDFEKMSHGASAREMIRKRALGGLGGGVSQFGNRLFDNVFNVVDQRSQDVNYRASGGIAAARAAMMGAQQARMMGRSLGARDYGQMAGQGLAAMLPMLMSTIARPALAKNDKLNRMGHDLSYYSNAAPGLINGWLRNRQSFDENYDPSAQGNKWYSRIQKRVVNPFLNNTLFQMPASMGNRTRLNNPGVKDLTEPAIYDQMSRRSLVEVIPGLLTKQLAQQTAIANKMGADVTGVKEVHFNHIQGGFTSQKRANVDLRSSIFNRNEFSSAAGSFNTMVDTLDPNNELSPNARVALAMRFAKDAEAGDGFNVNSYLKSSGWGTANKDAVQEITEFLHKRFDTREATGKAKAFGEFQIGDAPELAQMRNNLSNIMQAQSQYMPNVEQSLNTMANSGSRAQLKDMGVIKRVNGQDVFNHEMYWEMMQKFISNPNYRPDREGEDENERGSNVDPGAELGAMGREAMANFKRGVTDQFGNLRGKLTRDQEEAIRDQLAQARANGVDAYNVVKRQLTARYGDVAVGRIVRRLDNSFGQRFTDKINGFSVDGAAASAGNAARAAGQGASDLFGKIKGASLDTSGVKQALMDAASNGKEALRQATTELQRRFGRQAVEEAAEEIAKAGDVVKSSSDVLGSRVAAAVSRTRAGVSSAMDEATESASETAAIVQAQLDNNAILREVVGVLASVRDATAATKDATIAQVTGNPDILKDGITERASWLRGLGKRMGESKAGRIARFSRTVFKHLPNINTPVMTVAKWATIGPAVVGFKATRGLWNMLRDKKRGDAADPDHDGVRNNSVFDLLRRRKQQKLEQDEAKRAHNADDNGKEKEKPTTLFGLVAGLFSSVTGLVSGIKEFGILGGLAKFLGLGWVGDLIGGLGKILAGKKAIDAASDIMDDLGDGDEGDDRRSRRRGRRTGGRGGRGRGGLIRRLAGGTARGVKRLGAGIGRRTAGALRAGVGGNLKTLVKGGGIVTAGLSAFEAYSAYKEGDDAGAAEAVGSGVGGILGGAAMGAAIGSVVPVVGTAIGAVAGGAIGALGGGAIGRSLYGWFNDPGLLQQMRLRQYGVPDNDTDHVSAILKLEAALEPYVKTTDDGYASLDPKAPIAKLASGFVDDPNDRDQVESFAGWFLHRFKPVFLTHKAVAKQVLPSQSFMDLDKSTDEAAKYEIAKRAQQFDDSADHPYTFTGRVFPDLNATDRKQTEALVKDVVDRLRVKASKMTTGKSTSVFATGMSEVASKRELSGDMVKAINPTGDIPGLNTVGHKESSWFTGDRTVVSAGDILGGLLPKSGQPMDDLTALRMKVYGLPTLDVDRVSTLLQLELVMANKVKFTDSGATFDGKASDIYRLVAASFGLNPSSQWSYKSWEPWFTRRFLPAYLSFAGTVYTQTGDTRPTLAVPKMPPELKFAAATAMANAKYTDGVNAISVWTIKTSPWSTGEMNDDASIIQNHLNNLKAQVKQAQYSAEAVKGGVQQNKDGTTEKEWRKDSSGNMVNNQVKTSTGQVYTSQRQVTTYNPETGRIETAYGGGAGQGAGGASGGVDNTGKVGPIKLGPGAQEGARILIRQAVKAGITDKNEIAMLLAQTHLESGGFSKLEENLRYKAETLMKLWPNRFPSLAAAQQLATAGPVAIANAIYGGRMGNDKPGDGWKYRGRGFMQLTGKANYAAASKGMGVDLVSDPDKLSTDPEMAAKSALWYWKSRGGIEDAAKKGDLNTVTKLINGGTHGLAERGQLFKQYTDLVGTGKFDDIISGKDTSAGAQTDDASTAQTSVQQGGPDSPALSGAKTAAELTAPGASAANAAAAAPVTPPSGQGDAPALKSTTGPSVSATVSAGSSTPNAKDSTASAIDNQASTTPPPGAATTPTLNTPPQMQPTQAQVPNAPQVVAATPAPAQPVMPKESVAALSGSKDHLSSIDDKMTSLVDVLRQFIEMQMQAMSKPAAATQQPASGTGAPAVDFRRKYGNQ